MREQERLPGDWINTQGSEAPAMGQRYRAESEEVEQPLGAEFLRVRRRERKAKRSGVERTPSVMDDHRWGAFSLYAVRWVLLLGGMALVCVALRNYNYKLWVHEQALVQEVKEQRRHSIVLTSELMRISRETQVSVLVEERGLGLEESTEPPVVVVYQHR